MDAYTLYLQTLYNGLIDQGKPVPVRLRAMLNREFPHLLLQHPTGTWRDNLLTSIEFDSAVLSLAIRPVCKETNGREWLAVGLKDGRVQVRDLRTGELLWYGTGHTRGVESIAWSSEGLLASGGGDNGKSGEVLVWRPNPETREGPPQWRGIGHAGTVSCVGWSQKGLLASGGREGQVLVWRPDLEDRVGTPLWCGEGHRYWVSSVCWYEESLLASAGHDSQVLVWRPDLKAEVGVPQWIGEGHGAWVNSVSWSLKGLLAGGGGDEAVLVWQPDLHAGSGTPLWRGEGHTRVEGTSSVVSSVNWLSEDLLASGGYDRQVLVWRPDIAVKKSKPLWRGEGHTEGVACVTGASTGLLASGGKDRQVLVWRPDLTSGDSTPLWREERHTGTMESVGWSMPLNWANEGLLASGGGDNGKPGEVLVWRPDVGTGEKTPLWRGHGHTNLVSSVDWSMKGVLASGGGEHGFAAYGEILVWYPNLKAREGAPIWRGVGLTEMVAAVNWSKRGLLASGDWDGQVLVWHPELEAREGAPLWQGAFGGHTNAVMDVAWSSAGLIASSGKDRQILVWRPDLKEGIGAPLWRGKGHTEGVSCVRWSEPLNWAPEGLLASASENGRVLIWKPDQNVAEGEPLWQYPATSSIHSLAWSPDGQWLAMGTIRRVFVFCIRKRESGVDGRLAAGFPVPARIRLLRWFGSNTICAVDDGGGTGVPRIYRLQLGTEEP